MLQELQWEFFRVQLHNKQKTWRDAVNRDVVDQGKGRNDVRSEVGMGKGHGGRALNDDPLHAGFGPVSARTE